MPAVIAVVVSFIVLSVNACALIGGGRVAAQERQPKREAVIARAQVWQRTDVPSMDLKRGPVGEGAFAFGEIVTCDFVDKSLEGASPKFPCQVSAQDEVKVKYGGTNGEVYGEVLATRLLWALGFGADRMYPVKVVCRGCPAAFNINGRPLQANETLFDPAVIERKMPGHDLKNGNREGWAWSELDLVNEEQGGAPRAQRDALKLLAVMIQHTDNKPQQQRLVCLDANAPEEGVCQRPFMMINDLGLTFGRANLFNANSRGSVNLMEWSRTPVWKDDRSCVGNMPKSFTGTLEYPVISEGGRGFLAGLLTQLSDGQLRDLFEVARVTVRPRDPSSGRTGFPTIDEWVNAFKQKRTEITSRQCA